MPTIALPDISVASAPARLNTISWVSRIVVFAATSIVVGILWDISWHRTIGRDTFWTPAHLAIYLGGALGGLTAGWLVVRTTFFASAEERAGAVRLWGFRGPMGAWVSIWGSIAMLASAPFDDWWHNAYGLDVKIISPPHSVLALGMWSVVGGALLMVLREQNNSRDSKSPRGRWLFVYAAGVLMTMAAVFLVENSFPNQHHAHKFYTWSCATYPLYLVGIARATKFRWGATMIAAVYMLIIATMVWLLPLFPGEPKLGPIYHRVDHFVPLPFPLLLIVPAFVIDLIRNAMGHGRGWLRDCLTVLLCATAFVAVFTLVQWNFSKFLLSPSGQNWFFAADRHWGYTERMGPWRQQFWHEGRSQWNQPVTVMTFIMASVLATISGGIGLVVGNWMAKVRR